MLTRLWSGRDLILLIHAYYFRKQGAQDRRAVDNLRKQYVSDDFVSLAGS